MVGRAPAKEMAGVIVQDRYVSREHLILEETAEGQMRLQVTGNSAVALDDGSSLDPGTECVRPLPLQIVIGYTQLKISAVPADPPTEAVAGLATISRPLSNTTSSQPSLAIAEEHTSAETIAKWFERLMAVQRAAAGSEGFYFETARAVVDLVGLDRGLVVLRENEQWRIAAAYSRISNDDTSYSQTVLGQLLKQRRTFFESSLQQPSVASLARLDAYVREDAQ